MGARETRRKMLDQLQAPLAPPPPLKLDGLALFLDIDGTLAPIEARPEAVRPTMRRSALLGRLSEALSGRLAVISGRALASIDEILDSRVVCAAGVHGLERRNPGGSVLRPPAHPGIPQARAALAEIAATEEGLLLEDKVLSLALHYRLAPASADRITAEARRLAHLTGLTLQLGDQVVELKTPGADKGAAVRAYMEEPPFTGSQPVFVGDDLTDEDAFAVAAGLGGFGVLVGPRRETAAQWRLADVEAVLAWLEASLEQGNAGD